MLFERVCQETMLLVFLLFNCLFIMQGMPDNVFSLAMVCIILNATAMSMVLTHLYDPMKRYASNYDDIYTLALTKFTSLIVLPFHKKWSYDGNCVEIEDETLRELNFRVMERAPCSVGTLIERAKMTHVFSPETPYTVCLLFIGGKDD